MIGALNDVELNEIKLKCLSLSKEYLYSTILDNNEHKNALELQSTEYIFSAGFKSILSCNVGNAFSELNQFLNQHKGEYCILFLSYDLKNEIENLNSAHLDHIGFPDITAFVPEHFFRIKTNGKFEYSSSEFYDKILLQKPIEFTNNSSIKVEAKVCKEDYIHTVQQIRNHIINGDVYELNYCTEFYAKNVYINPYETYFNLNKISPTPFSVFASLNGKFMMGASPERFLKKEQNKIYSQPIKGTSKRSSNPIIDNQNKQYLLDSEKEKAENLMIVDLVRNDLAKSSKTASVKVEELFGIYSFKQVHQMISTVSAEYKDDLSLSDIIKNAFPMGSMTGAPKVMAMQLIDRYEQTKRGMYSGAVGYIEPNGNFDFNVVIRSLQYNSEKKYLNFEVGSAITFDSNPEEEYQECLLKAEAMMRVLDGTN